MNLTQLLAQARIYLQDPSGVRWPDAELTQWLNEAQDEFAIATGATQTDAALAVNAKTPANAFYTLPSDLIALTAVSADGVTLPPLSLQSVECLEDWESETGEPDGYLYGPWGHGLIRLWPYEATTVKCWYVRQPAQLALGADTPEVQAIYHAFLAHGAVVRAFSKNGSSTADPQKVAYHRSEYERGVSLALSQRSSPPAFVPYRHL